MRNLVKELILALEEEERGYEESGELIENEIAVDPEFMDRDLNNEVRNLSDEIVELSDVVSDTSDELQTIERIKDVLSAGPETLDETAAELATVAVENILNRLKITTTQYSLESIQNTKQAHFALENLNEISKRVLTSIMTALEKLLNYVKEFFVNLFDSNLKVMKQAEMLKAYVEKLSVSELTNTDFKDSAISNAFGGKDVDVQSVVDLIKSHIAFTKAGNDLFKKSSDLVSELDRVLANTSLSSLAAKASELSGKAEKIFMDATRSSGFSKTVMADNGAEIHVGPFVNGNGLVITMSDNPNSNCKLPLFSVHLNAERKAGDDEIKTLTKDDILKVLSDVIALCDENVTYKEKFPQFEKMFKTSIKLVNDLLKSLEKLTNDATNETPESGKVIKEIGVFVQTLSQSLSKFASKVPSYNVDCALATVRYVKVSLRQMKFETKSDLEVTKTVPQLQDKTV